MVFVLAACVVAACSTETPVKQPADAAAEPRMRIEYVSGMAAAYFCTCERWPESWAELRRFDDNLHGKAEQGGQAPLRRFDWGGIEAVVSVQVDGSLGVRPEAGSEDEYLEPFGVPVPDCSRFDRSRFESACPVVVKATRTSIP